MHMHDGCHTEVRLSRHGHSRTSRDVIALAETGHDKKSLFGHHNCCGYKQSVVLDFLPRILF
jgi:hypothetical protein